MESIKRFLRIGHEKKKSFTVHWVQKVVHEQDEESLAQCQRTSSGRIETKKCEPIMQPRWDETDEEEFFSLDGILFGRTCFHDFDAGIVCWSFMAAYGVGFLFAHFVMYMSVFYTALGALNSFWCNDWRLKMVLPKCPKLCQNASQGSWNDETLVSQQLTLQVLIKVTQAIYHIYNGIPCQEKANPSNPSHL
jgi:hypothetical protein